MAETEPSTPKVTKKPRKPARPATHPKYSEMINDALVTLKSRTGSSRQAIAKYIKANFKVGDHSDSHLKLALKRMVAAGTLMHTKGTGASGSFKLVKPGAQVKEVVKPAPKRKPVAKKATPKPKAKAKPPTKKASPKKAKRNQSKRPTPKKPVGKPKKVAKKSPKKPAKRPVSKRPAAKKPKTKGKGRK